MGFRPKRTQLDLTFPGTDLDGLEVAIGSVSVDELTRMLGGAEAKGADAIAENNWLLGMFAERLISWNLEDEAGVPVPATREGMGQIESNLMTRLISAWQIALTSAPPPLPSASPPGGTPGATAESTLGLASSSQSLPS